MPTLLEHQRSKRMPKPAAFRELTTGRKIVIKTMLDSGMSYRQVASLERVSVSTVHDINHDPDLKNLNPNIVEATKRSLAGRCYTMADKSISMASQKDRMDKMNSYQLTVMGSIMIDKARLMDGLSTENLALHNIGDHLQKGAKDLDNMKDMIMKRFRMLEDDRKAVIDGESEDMSESDDNQHV